MARSKKGQSRIIPACHPEKLHFALQMCRACYFRDYVTKRRAKDPSYERYRGWAYHIQAKYGMSADEFKAMLEDQGGHCKLCMMTPNENYKAFCIDHDHVTGRLRGILCKFCNSKLGWYENRRSKIEDYIK